MKRLNALFRLLRTTPVRLALRYAFIYTVILTAGLTAIWWISSRHIDGQTKASLSREFATLTAQYSDADRAQLPVAITQHLRAAPGPGWLYLLVSGSGQTLAGNLRRWPEEGHITLDGKVRGLWVEEDLIQNDTFENDLYCAVIGKTLPDGSQFLLAQSIKAAEDMKDISEILATVVAICGVAVFLALIMSITLGLNMLRRMGTVSATAGEIMAGDLSKRVPVSRRNDEFDALAQGLNTMLDRIQQLIKGMHEVTDNVAHDLRSPLTRLRNRLEITMLEPRADQEYRDTISQSIEDTESLIRTFNALLGIAQTEAGNDRTPWGALDLSALAVDVAELYDPLAEDRGQTLELVRNRGVSINGSRHLLAQALGNLLDNAIKYSPRGGHIQLRVTQTAEFAEVSVADTGPGIPGAQRDRVLERFVRLDSARHSPGNGLGLSLVKAICKLHGAQLSLDDARPGLVVTLRFKRVAQN